MFLIAAVIEVKDHFGDMLLFFSTFIFTVWLLDVLLAVKEPEAGTTMSGRLCQILWLFSLTH